ncbi:hypothetical protein CDAR_209241 [Caerostris darwini]|uniref:GIY-YIG homing endonuclease n=1 Tax=Caerostris darwini TaxID=1538125 RepID=A0AAV4VGI9_9ARAC|nr:hypothetical protein CDAR_209241 [Caerostris darwini]
MEIGSSCYTCQRTIYYSKLPKNPTLLKETKLMHVCATSYIVFTHERTMDSLGKKHKKGLPSKKQANFQFERGNRAIEAFRMHNPFEDFAQSSRIIESTIQDS